MSFEDIQIHRDLQIVNRYVQLPPNTEDKKTLLRDNDVELAGSTTIRLTGASGPQTGSRHGQHESLRLPGISPDEWYTTDPVEELQE